VAGRDSVAVLRRGGLAVRRAGQESARRRASWDPTTSTVASAVG